MLLSEFAADPQARAAALVAHDLVVTVYEADERDGVPYIAAQLLWLRPSEQCLKRSADPRPAIKLGYEAALGRSAGLVVSGEQVTLGIGRDPETGVKPRGNTRPMAAPRAMADARRLERHVRRRRWCGEHHTG